MGAQTASLERTVNGRHAFMYPPALTVSAPVVRKKHVVPLLRSLWTHCDDGSPRRQILDNHEGVVMCAHGPRARCWQGFREWNWLVGHALCGSTRRSVGLDVQIGGVKPNFLGGVPYGPCASDLLRHMGKRADLHPSLAESTLHRFANVPVRREEPHHTRWVAELVIARPVIDHFVGEHVCA
eukprot:scaffold258397_cov31-Tisochrysis_lutea.AAC.2